MWKSKLLPLFLFFALLSCSSLPPVVSSVDGSPAVERPPTTKPSPTNTPPTGEQLRQRLLDLRALLVTLKNTAGNLTPLLDSFDKQLTALEQSNQSLRQDLQIASDASTKLQADLDQLRRDFDDYRAQVRRDQIRDGVIIGGAGFLAGGIIGFIIGLLVK